MALRIVYAMEGMDVSKDEDLYDIGLPNWEVQRDPRRKPIKTETEVYRSLIDFFTNGSHVLSTHT